MAGMANFVFSARRGSWLLAETLELQGTQDELEAARAELADLKASFNFHKKALYSLGAAAVAMSAVGLVGLAAIAGRAGAKTGKKFAGAKSAATLVSKPVDGAAQAAAGGAV